MRGPGKYDDLATVAREAAEADAVILIVLGGKHGSGFAVQAHGFAREEVEAKLVSFLREVADEVEARR
jgi:hypothetical protein